MPTSDFYYTCNHLFLEAFMDVSHELVDFFSSDEHCPYGLHSVLNIRAVAKSRISDSDSGFFTDMSIMTRALEEAELP